MPFVGFNHVSIFAGETPYLLVKYQFAIVLFPRLLSDFQIFAI